MAHSGLSCALPDPGHSLQQQLLGLSGQASILQTWLWTGSAAGRVAGVTAGSDLQVSWENLTEEQRAVSWEPDGRGRGTGNTEIEPAWTGTGLGPVRLGGQLETPEQQMD